MPSSWLTYDAEDAEMIATFERWRARMHNHTDNAAPPLRLHLNTNALMVLGANNEVFYQASLPISLHELSEWWRTYRHPTDAHPAMLHFHREVRLDAHRRLLHSKTAILEVTEKECELLIALHRAREDGITKEALLHTVWGYHPDTETHTLDTHLYRLRQKIAELSSSLRLEITVLHGIYRIHVEEQPS